MNILVTGSSGFIGKPLCEALRSKGNKVREFDIRIGNEIESEDEVRAACNGIDLVVHAASVQGTRRFYDEPEKVLSVGVNGIINALKQSIKEGVTQVIYLSSSEVFHCNDTPTSEDVSVTIPDVKNPRFSYSASKIFGEMLTLHYASKFMDRVCIVRPFNVYGPGQCDDHVVPALIKKIKESSDGKIEIQGTGEETRSFIYIDDFIDGMLKVIDHGENKEIYNIGREEETRIDELALRIAGCLGENVVLRQTPLRPGSPTRRCPDISKLKALGFSPNISLAEGLRKTVRSFD